MSTSGHFFVYMLASKKYGSIYTGVTGDLPGRIYIHREALIQSFTSRYHIHRLVYFEQHDEPLAAITREKQLKKWRRDWKIELIERDNPEGRDLFEEIASWRRYLPRRRFPPGHAREKRVSPFPRGLGA